MAEPITATASGSGSSNKRARSPEPEGEQQNGNGAGGSGGGGGRSSGEDDADSPKQSKRPNLTNTDGHQKDDTAATTTSTSPDTKNVAQTENGASTKSTLNPDDSTDTNNKPKMMMDVDEGAGAPSTSAPGAEQDQQAGGDQGQGENAGGNMGGSQAEGSSSSVPPQAVVAAAPPVQNIQMRALIVTQDASIIIGKQGKHIHEIREKSGARVNVSEAIPGNPERILNVSGPLDAVSKAFSLVVRRINDEPFDVPSVPGSRAVTIRLIIPNSRMGSVIGKQGSKIKEIQEASGARLQASEAMLPGSTERVLSVSGVADAIHIAVYYIGNIILEHSDRQTTNQTYRQQPAPGGAARGPYGGAGPGPAGGGGGRGVPYGGGGPGYGPGPGPGPAPGPGPGPGPGMPGSGIGPGGYISTAGQPGSQTQEIFIPNELVGSIIGKGGQKINEIRHMSASHIKIMEPGEVGNGMGQPGERLVTITGQPHNIQMAINMLYQRLGEEKAKQQAGGV